MSDGKKPDAEGNIISAKKIIRVSLTLVATLIVAYFISVDVKG